MGQKSPLQIQAYEYLKDMILSGKLDPDVLYSETRMSAEIGISRTPMREAIQCLSQDGYITVVPSKGFMLRKLSEEDMEETIQIRCAIEGFWRFWSGCWKSRKRFSAGRMVPAVQTLRAEPAAKRR